MLTLVTSLTACAAVLVDRLAGEPRRWHPLVGFGLLSAAVERRRNRRRRSAGVSSLEEALESGASIVVVCNPNNPTATRLPRAALLPAAAQLAQRSGWLIVDEAFADAEPEDSLVAVAGTPAAPNLVVLRSLGKFFGLAGARVGFVFAAQSLLDRLAERVGPWAVSGPAREVAKLALLDAEWQRQTRLELEGAADRLQRRLARLGPARATRLFCSLRLERAEALAEHLASRGILVRAFPGLPLLRFGLWATEGEWSRLDAALSQWEAR